MWKETNLRTLNQRSIKKNSCVITSRILTSPDLFHQLSARKKVPEQDGLCSPHEQKQPSQGGCRFWTRALLQPHWHAKTETWRPRRVVAKSLSPPVNQRNKLSGSKTRAGTFTWNIFPSYKIPTCQQNWLNQDWERRKARSVVRWTGE